MPVLSQTQPPARMNFDEFMAWYKQQEGHWELHDGVPVRLHDPARGQVEQAGHVRAKHRIVRSLEDAIARAGCDCEALGDGMSVKIDDNVSYEPDALVYCGPLVEDDALVVPNPVIIVEVLSPSTAYKDTSDKLVDYFRLPTVEHYLVIDPKNGLVTHHFRDGRHVSQRAVHGNKLQLTPPGIMVELDGLRA